MKGIIQLAVEVDYNELMKNSDVETLKLFTGSNGDLDVLEYHLDGISRHLTQVVSKFKFANYYIESDLFQNQEENLEEQGIEETVQNENEIEYTEESSEIEDHVDNSSESFASDLEEMFWSEIKTDSITQGLVDSYLSANDRGTIMKIVVNDKLEDVLKEEIKSQGWEVDVQSEAMEELYGIIIDPTDDSDADSDEFIVIFKGKDGSEYSQVSTW